MDARDFHWFLVESQIVNWWYFKKREGKKNTHTHTHNAMPYYKINNHQNLVLCHLKP